MSSQYPSGSSGFFGSTREICQRITSHFFDAGVNTAIAARQAGCLAGAAAQLSSSQPTGHQLASRDDDSPELNPVT
jgi:hypothetical protein